MVRLDRFCYRKERGSGVLCNGAAAQRNGDGSRIAACALPSSPVPGNCRVTQHNRSEGGGREAPVAQVIEHNYRSVGERDLHVNGQLAPIQRLLLLA